MVTRLTIQLNFVVKVEPIGSTDVVIEVALNPESKLCVGFEGELGQILTSDEEVVNSARM